MDSHIIKGRISIAEQILKKLNDNSLSETDKQKVLEYCDKEIAFYENKSINPELIEIIKKIRESITGKKTPIKSEDPRNQINHRN